MSLLAVEHLTYSYDGLLNSLSDVTFAVQPGTVTGLIGPNGSGKSTLIKNVFDLLRLQSGTIRVGGLEHATTRAKAQAIYLTSNDYLPEFLSAREYIALLAQLYDRPLDHDEAQDLFRRFSMPGRYDDLIEGFSHGMRKKTQLISALLMRRPLTVVDETLNGMDLEALHLSEKYFEAMRAEGLAVLLCTHDFTLLERLADRILFLDLGQLVADAPTADLVAEHGALATMVYDHLESEVR